MYRDAEVIDSSPRLSRDRDISTERSERFERSERSEQSNKPLSISLRSPAKTKPSTPVKKIDLGNILPFYYITLTLKCYLAII